MRKDTLQQGDFLTTDQQLNSQDSNLQAILQNDGNFVIYHSNTAIWASNTCGQHVYRLLLQNDGNLVLYGLNRKPIWASNTRGVNNRLVLQNDGNLVLYSKNNDALWSSGSLLFDNIAMPRNENLENILLQKVVYNISKKQFSLEHNQHFITLIQNTLFCFANIIMDDHKNVSCHLYGRVSNQAKDFGNIMVSKINSLKSHLSGKLNFFMQFEDGMDYPSDIIEYIKKHIIFVNSCSKLGREDIEILIPDYYLLQQKTRDTIRSTLNNNIPFHKRIPIAKFRGSQTGGLYNMEQVRKMNLPRLKASHLSKQFPQYLDSKLFSYNCQNTGGQEYINYMNSTFGPPATKEPMENFNKYRYLLSMDGNTATYSRPEIIMFSGSVLFLQTEYIKYWSCFLQDGYNCILIKEDLSNLIPKIKEMNENYEQSLQIANNAKELAQQVIHPYFQDYYFIKVLNLIRY